MSKQGSESSDIKYDYSTAVYKNCAQILQKSTCHFKITDTRTVTLHDFHTAGAKDTGQHHKKFTRHYYLAPEICTTLV